MALVFYRRLALPLWTLGLFAVIVTASPAATRVLVWALGITVVAVVIRPVIPWWWRTSCQVLHNPPVRHADGSRAALGLAALTRGRAIAAPASPADNDALDFGRMDDDGWLPQR